MNSKKLLTYGLVFSVVLALVMDTVNADNSQPLNSVSVKVNGTITGKDIEHVVKEGAKVVKKVVKEGGKVVKKVGKEGKKVVKKVGKKIKKIFG